MIYKQSETEGFGAVIQEEGYKENLVGKNIKEIESVDGISGATITSDAVTTAVNTGLLYIENYLKIGGK